MFLDEISRIAKIVRSAIKEKNVKVFAQFDADGICSAAIIVKMLVRENANFTLRVFSQLTKDVIEGLEFNENDFLIFVDCGSGQLDFLRRYLDKTQILILDHHEPVILNNMNLFHLNPLVFGEEEISASMVCYLFAKCMNIRNSDTADLAIVGAIGDIQDEKWELKDLARKILEEAETLGKVSTSKGLRIYGRNSRPIYKTLAYSFDPFIPGISGSESQALQFLSEIGISVKEGEYWKKLSDLTLEEQKRLASAIIVERLKENEEMAEDIFGEIYTLLGRPDEFQDAREFATIINACGRTDNSDIGIRLCLGDLSITERVLNILDQYRKMVSDCLNWVRENNTIASTSFLNYVIAGSSIPSSIIGTITSIILNSGFVDITKPIFGFADTLNNKVKVSVRAAKKLKINLREIVLNAANAVGGEGGGHYFASGALIPKGKEQEFIKIADSLIGERIGNKEN